ncbi:MAG: twin-arginine translocase subunit TatC [Kouleothrix sp.]|jgi:sec-independent protein translocase protein TatC|nr:twin-arginine translocase subunit TatC [Kouleothrix sp.]
MSNTQLYLAVGVLLFLIGTPLLIALLVRVLIRDTPAGAEVAETDAETLAGVQSLGDFWAGIAPHLVELRNRLSKALLAVLVGTVLGFWLVNSTWLLGDTIPNLLIRHFVPPEIKLQFIEPAEAFVSYMRVALVIGVALAVPVIVYQLIAFFIPGLLPHEQRILFTALPFVTELFVAGLAFGWFFTIPAALSFLFTFGTSARIEAQPTFESFISTVATLMLWNGLIFELPAVIYLLARLGIVNTAMLKRTRRYAIVIIVIAAAIITPTGDPYNLLLLAVPMYLLYELGILLARFVPAQAS